MSGTTDVQPAAASAPQRWALRVRRVEGAPVVAVRLWLRGGARLEQHPGLTLITGRGLLEGSRRRDWRQIADAAEALGMQLSSSGGFEGHGLSIEALAADWRQALDWLAELILEPSFPQDRCAWLARQAAGELESLNDQPDIRTTWGFLEHLYTPHRLARPLHGSAESLASLRSADLAAWHRQGLEAGGIVAVTGPIDEDAVTTSLQQLFPGGEEPATLLPAAPQPVGLPEARREVPLSAGEQAHLFVGHLSVRRNHPDVPALELAAVVLGAGTGVSGRIPLRIREQEGLAYTAYAHTAYGAGLDAGRMMAYVGTAPANVEQAERGVREEIQRLVNDGIGDAELEQARAFLLGREPFRRETARQWADLLVDAELYGLPLDQPEWRQQQLRQLDLPAVEAAVRRHVHPERLQTTVGLPR